MVPAIDDDDSKHFSNLLVAEIENKSRVTVNLANYICICAHKFINEKAKIDYNIMM